MESKIVAGTGGQMRRRRGSTRIGVPGKKICPVRLGRGGPGGKGGGGRRGGGNDLAVETKRRMVVQAQAREQVQVTAGRKWVATGQLVNSTPARCAVARCCGPD